MVILKLLIFLPSITFIFCRTLSTGLETYYAFSESEPHCLDLEIYEVASFLVI